MLFARIQLFLLNGDIFISFSDFVSHILGLAPIGIHLLMEGNLFPNLELVVGLTSQSTNDQLLCEIS